jgi:twitching motility protein PilT
VRKLTELQNGLVLITGPTGSGKTTTLAALVHEINKTSSRHIITIEDPIEYVHAPLQSVVTHVRWAVTWKASRAPCAQACANRLTWW